MVSIDRSAASLDDGGRKLAKSISRLGDLERDYNRAVECALIKLYDQAKRTGERLPAEDVRQALAHAEVPSDIYGAFLSAKAEVDAGKAWLRSLEAAVNARQSLLKAMRDELAAAS